MTQALNNVVYLQTLITLPDVSSITDDTVVAVYEAVKSIKQKMAAQKLYLDEGIEILKKYMGKSEVLISNDGRKLATWKQQYKKILNDKLLKDNFPSAYEACCNLLDVDLLKAKFAEEYELCCEAKDGNKPFCLE